MFGDTIDRISVVDPVTGETLGSPTEILVFPATHYVAGEERMRAAMLRIEAELAALGVVQRQRQTARGPASWYAHAL